ncbi:MAG: thioredoxin domain-containing protein, partial [Candidatus Deferrimicrobiaceae bacterium]
LYRTFMDGIAKNHAYLEDHAFLIAGLLDLYEATSDPQWLEKAIELDKILEEHFEDRIHGGYFLTGDDHEELLVREKPSYDGAEPSGNSVAALNLLRLHEFTTEDGYRRRAEMTFRFMAETLRSNPLALSEMLLAVDFYLDAPKQILLVAPRGEKGAADPLMAVFRGRFLPNRVFSVVSAGEEQERNARLVPLLRGKEAAGGRATAYVCENRTCGLPTNDPAEFARQLLPVKALPVDSGKE